MDPFRRDMGAELDGIALLRYAHIFRCRTSGGAEQYLRQLNDGLLSRHRMTILQMHLVPNGVSADELRVEIEPRGLGRVIWVPVPFQTEERSVHSIPRRLRTLASGAGVRSLPNLAGHLRYSTMILSEGLVNTLDEYRVDTVLFHWLSYDVPALVAQICRRCIPYAVVHHFDNSRLESKLAHRVMHKASAVGGVSARSVPAYLRGKYVNLSDAVDVSFFAPGSASVLDGPDGFVVLLPSRIAQGKGHRDLLLAGKTLALEGLDITIAFAGTVESESLLLELKAEVASLNMVGRVLFLGELEREALRDWYAHSDVVVLPSWSEGLGRVLLEAQAMGRPVIAYATGGTPEALLDGGTGYLVEKGNFTALAERIKHLARHPSERTAMGQLGSKFVLDRYAPHALVRRHEDFLRMALGQRRAS